MEDHSGGKVCARCQGRKSQQVGSQRRVTAESVGFAMKQTSSSNTSIFLGCEEPPRCTAGVGGAVSLSGPPGAPYTEVFANGTPGAVPLCGPLGNFGRVTC